MPLPLAHLAQQRQPSITPTATQTVALGMSINMLISENSPVYSVNELIEGAFGSGKQLEWKW